MGEHFAREFTFPQEPERWRGDAVIFQRVSGRGAFDFYSSEATFSSFLLFSNGSSIEMGIFIGGLCESGEINALVSPKMFLKINLIPWEWVFHLGKCIINVANLSFLLMLHI